MIIDTDICLYRSSCRSFTITPTGRKILSCNTKITKVKGLRKPGDNKPKPKSTSNDE